jgi:penicillin-binding protein-related factor A (putative recombinase)
MLRTLKNDGQWLEKDLADCHAVYEAKGIAAISKVEPPVRVIYSHPKQIIMLENPYGDFIGCWTVRAGRNIHMEAKSTSDDRLPINGASGLRPNQIAALRRWRAAGAAVCVLWGFQGAVRYLSLSLIEARLANGAKSILWAHADAIPAGMGFLRFDWLRNLEGDKSLLIPRK